MKKNMQKHRIYKFIILGVFWSLLATCNNSDTIESESQNQAFTRNDFSSVMRPGKDSNDFKFIPQFWIDFDINNSLDTYQGKQTLFVRNNLDTDIKAIGFFLLPRIIGGSLDVESMEIEKKPVTFEIKNAILTLKPEIPIPPGTIFTIDINFKGTIPKTLQPPGVFISDKGTVCLGGFYPELIPFNRTGTFDPIQPTDFADPIFSPLASYNVTFRAPEGMQFAASGRVEPGESINKRQTYKVISGPVRDFFLAGSFHWEKVSFRKNGIKISSFYPEKNMYQGINAYYYTSDALKIFERSLGAYPYNEMDVISAPLGEHAVGMEYPGIIVLNDLLYEPEGTFFGFSADYVMEITIAHEIAHQWFYNLIGSDPVREPWIDEAITQYATWLYFETNRGSGPGNLFYSSLESRWSRIRNRPIPANMQATEYTRREYSAILYGRATLFYFELIRLWGQEAFNRYLEDYTNLYRWKAATTDVVRELVKKHFGQKGDQLFYHWIMEPEPNKDK